MVDEGDILDKGTTEIENVVDEGVILDKGTTEAETVVGEGYILNKGTIEVEIVVDDTIVDIIMDEGLNCNMKEDEGLGEETNVVDEGPNCNPIKDDGLYGGGNEIDLDEYNTIVEEGLDGGSEDDPLKINFEDSNDDVGMNEDMAVAEDEILEEDDVDEQRNEKEKKKGNGKGKGKSKGKVGRPPRKLKQCEGSILDDCVNEEETNVNLKGLSDIDDENSEDLFEDYYSEYDCVGKVD